MKIGHKKPHILFLQQWLNQNSVSENWTSLLISGITKNAIQCRDTGSLQLLQLLYCYAFQHNKPYYFYVSF